MTEIQTEAARSEAAPRTWLGYSIAALILFLPGGIGALYHSAQVRSRWAAGDARGARAASIKARTWAWSSLVIGITLLSLILIMGLVWGSNDQNSYG